MEKNYCKLAMRISLGPVSLGRALVLVFMLLTFAICGCEPTVRERPYGYIRLGPIQDFLAEETYRPDMRLLIRRDVGGFSAMSTECTKDLTTLEIQQLPAGEKIWVSRYSASTYAYDGKLRSGPAQHDLPYFELRFEPGKYGGPVDTLYAVIGPEKGKDWRLKVPTS